MNVPTSPAMPAAPAMAQGAKTRPVLTAAPPAVPSNVAPIRQPAEPGQPVLRAPHAKVVGPVRDMPPLKAPTGVPNPSAIPKIWTPAAPSRLRLRHTGLIASFLLCVLAPLVVAAWYLYARAADQFASTLGFSVHKESIDSAFSLITGLASISGSASPDTDIIYSYVYSQDLVAEIDKELDLRSIWNRDERDFYFSLGEDRSIEDLVDYWSDMVMVNYDSATRLIEIKVLAFMPEDAQTIAALIYKKSTAMINQLNEAALKDAVSFTAAELERTRETVIAARQAMTAFRNEHQIVDPAADVAAQMALVGSLEQSLAETTIDLDLLSETAPANDPRRAPLERRIEVIKKHIGEERAKLGVGTGVGDETPIADVIAEYERLRVDQEFTEAAYHAARAAHESALSEAQRQSRYLAAHIMPTLAQTSRDPDRPVLVALTGGMLFMLWSIGALLFYSLRDRR